MAKNRFLTPLCCKVYVVKLLVLCCKGTKHGTTIILQYMRALKFERFTVYPVVNRAGKRDLTSQVVIRIHTKQKSLTLPVLDKRSPIKVFKEHFKEYRATGGFPVEKINHINGIIATI